LDIGEKSLGLSVRNLSKSFPAPGRELVVLRDVNLELERGRAVAVVGPSGSGKSTLLHILGTLDTPSSGSLSLEGVDPSGLSEPQLADFRNRRVGFVFQEHYLLPQCTVLENVMVPTLVGEHDGKVMDLAHRLVERVGLGDRIDHRPAELSGGERQRVAVARALIRKPALLLADEPTGNLDRRTADAVGELLLDLARQEQAILVVVTHSAALAGRLPDVLELVDGTLQKASGPC
jgi:lipoprotein-releasing system ATP-binding protein